MVSYRKFKEGDDNKISEELKEWRKQKERAGEMDIHEKIATDPVERAKFEAWLNSDRGAAVLFVGVAAMICGLLLVIATAGWIICHVVQMFHR